MIKPQREIQFWQLVRAKTGERTQWKVFSPILIGLERDHLRALNWLHKRLVVLRD